ncbi:pali-domain-containing protein [Mycena galericulata]|nr:pali-domain-containing protein [Mycena galericulata]
MALVTVLLSLSLILLLLVSLSVPFIKTNFLFRLTASSHKTLGSFVTDSVTFGVLGYCTAGVDVSALGLVHADVTPAECSKPHLGYMFDSTVAQALQVSGFENLISHTLTAVLALHPIVVALTFLALVASLVMYRRGSYWTSCVPSVAMCLFVTLPTTLVAGIDYGLVGDVANHVHNDTDGMLTISSGRAGGMTLGAAILLWIANVVVVVLYHKHRTPAGGDRRPQSTPRFFSHFISSLTVF